MNDTALSNHLNGVILRALQLEPLPPEVIAELTEEAVRSALTPKFIKPEGTGYYDRATLVDPIGDEVRRQVGKLAEEKVSELVAEMLASPGVREKVYGLIVAAIMDGARKSWGSFIDEKIDDAMNGMRAEIGSLTGGKS